MFLSDYPRAVINCLWICCFAALDALPVAPALAIAFLQPSRRFPITFLGLPLRPLPRSSPTLCTAIALAHVPRMKLLFTTLEQTRSRARLPGPAFRSSRLILARTCNTFGRAH